MRPAAMRSANSTHGRPAWETAPTEGRRNLTHHSCDCATPFITSALVASDHSRWCSRCLRPVRRPAGVAKSSGTLRVVR